MQFSDNGQVLRKAVDGRRAERAVVADQERHARAGKAFKVEHAQNNATLPADLPPPPTATNHLPRIL